MVLTGTEIEKNIFHKGGKTFVENVKFCRAVEVYQPTTFEDKSVIIVGNSPTILDCELGHVIDSNFDIVVRLNEFKTEGYEAFTGTRTDIWFTGASRSAVPRNNQNCEYEIVVGLPLRRARRLTTGEGCALINEELVKSIGASIEDVKFVPFPIVHRLRIHEGFANPSTGFMCIYSFAQFFSFKSVTIYGFDFFQNRWHYYDKNKVPANKISSSHKWDEERAIVKKWEREGNISIMNSDMFNSTGNTTMEEVKNAF